MIRTWNCEKCGSEISESLLEVHKRQQNLPIKYWNFCLDCNSKEITVKLDLKSKCSIVLDKEMKDDISLILDKIGVSIDDYIKISLDVFSSFLREEKIDPRSLKMLSDIRQSIFDMKFGFESKKVYEFNENESLIAAGLCVFDDEYVSEYIENIEENIEADKLEYLSRIGLKV